MEKLGTYIKQKRMLKSLTLRRFCEEVGLDPSNWSKIERGLLEGPKTEVVLKEIAAVLDLTTDEYQEMKDIAAIESIPKAIRPSSEIMEALPVFFRTARELKPSEENLKRLIELLKKS